MLINKKGKKKEEKERICRQIDLKESENKRKRKDRQMLGSSRELKKVKLESNGMINCSWCAWDGTHSFGKGSGRIRNQRKNGDHPE